MGFTFQEQQLVLPNPDHFKSTVFEKGESFSLGKNRLCGNRLHMDSI